MLAIAGILQCGCQREPAQLQMPDLQTGSHSPESGQMREELLFVDVTDERKLNARHQDGPSDSFEFPRSMGSGCGWIDANGDGRLDVILVNGGAVVGPDNTGPVAFLWLQQPDGQFTDFSATSGLNGTGYGMGLAAGDVDNDGDVDVYITKYGPDQLFLNDGAGRFEDVSLAAGILNPQWSTAAAFVDLNQDGRLDIVVANYVDYFPGTFCSDGSGRQDFCGPQDFVGVPNRIFMNQGTSGSGALRFEDVSGESGIGSTAGKSLGLVCRDFNNDGDVDIFVANDGEANQLWIRTSGICRDEAVLRGVAYNRLGEPEANMGTALADFTGDGQMDLLVTHLSGEMNTVWKGDAAGYFVDQTSRLSLGAAGLAQTGFGVAAADFNHDGYTDVVVANGKVKRDRHRMLSQENFWDNYAERNQIFLGDTSDLVETQDGSSGFTAHRGVYRGLAVGDADLDGDLDLLVSDVGHKYRIFYNQKGSSGHWICVIPCYPDGRRVAYGAKVKLETRSRTMFGELLPHVSYLSSSEPIVHFGLGEDSEIVCISITWPDEPDFVEEFSEEIAVDRRVTVLKGSGSRRSKESSAENREDL